MTRTAHILVVVDPSAAVQPALQRAARIAAPLGWALELLICLNEGVPARMLSSADPQAMRRALLAHQLGYLQGLGRQYPGLSVRTKAVWDRPLHEGIIRETLRSEPRLVMKDTHFHSAISRALFTNTDWHLIRECPAPLWLVHGGAWPDKPVVAAFVDPLHENDKPAELDHHILREADLFAERLGGEVHAVHCYDPGPLIVAASAAGMPGAAGHVEAFAAEMQAQHSARTSELAASHDIPPGRVHVRSGAAVDSIPAAVRELKADLAVMGAVARSRLQLAFLGRTAEQVLDRLPCDVLIVKPAHFESPVTYRAQAPDFMELH